MSVVDAITRVQQIQTELGALQAPASTGGDAFAALLSALQGGQSTPGTTFAAGRGVDAASTDGTGADGGVTGQQIVADAERYLGVPYVFGGESTSGMDCSGLVQKVLGDLGISAPRVVQDQAKIGTEVPSLAQAQPGDLIVEKGNGHIQIYAGDGMIIEAPKPGENVVKRKEWLAPDQIGTIRRVATATPQAADPAAAQPAAAAVSALLAQALGDGRLSSAGSGSTGDDDSDASPALSALTGASAPASALASLAAALPQQTAALASPPVAAAPVAAPAAPLPVPELTGQLSGPIAQLVAQPGGGHTVVVRVAPEHLGPVTVDARMTDHGLRIELSAPSDAGRDALGGILGDLRRDLAAGGIAASISLGSAAAGQSGAQGGQQNAQQTLVELFEQQRASAPASLASAPTAETTARRTGAPSSTDSLLDVLA